MSIKTGAERSIEALTWAAVVIWLGFTLIMNLLHYVGLVVMMLGIILLSSAIYQRSRGWHTSLSIWIFGIWMAVFAVLETVSNIVAAINGGAGLNIDLWVYLGIALISMGVAVVLRSVSAPGLAARGQGRTARDSAIRTPADPRSHLPRRVEDDFSSAYYPSPGEEAGAVADTAYTRPTDAYVYDDEAPTIATGYEAAVPRQPTPIPSPQPRQPTPVPRVPRQPTPVPGTVPASLPYQSEPIRYETDPLDQPAGPTGYETRRLDDEGYTYDAPQPRAAPQDYPPMLGEPRRPASRRAARRRSANPAAEPDDLQARVDDIIRRSRERRSAAPDERLPY